MNPSPRSPADPVTEGIPHPLARLVQDLPDELAVIDGVGQCITLSRVLAEACRKIGIGARAVACDFLAANAAAVPLLRASVPMADWPAEAYTVGTNCDSAQDDLTTPGISRDEPYRRKLFMGHMVVVGTKVSCLGGWFLDATVAQYSRPAKGIVFGGAMGGAIGDRAWGVETEIHAEHVSGRVETGLAMWRFRPEIANFRNTPAWREDARKAVAICAERMESYQ